MSGTVKSSRFLGISLVSPADGTRVDGEVGMLRVCMSTIRRGISADWYCWIPWSSLPRDVDKLCRKVIYGPVTS